MGTELCQHGPAGVCTSDTPASPCSAAGDLRRTPFIIMELDVECFTYLAAYRTKTSLVQRMATRQTAWPLIHYTRTESLHTHSTVWNGVHTLSELIRDDQELAELGAMQVFARINEYDSCRGSRHTCHVKVRGTPYVGVTTQCVAQCTILWYCASAGHDTAAWYLSVGM